LHERLGNEERGYAADGRLQSTRRCCFVTRLLHVATFVRATSGHCFYLLGGSKDFDVHNKRDMFNCAGKAAAVARSSSHARSKGLTRQVCSLSVAMKAALRILQKQHTCGEVQQAEVGVHDGLLAQHEQGHLGGGRLRARGLHLPDQQ
jgi:hypothetical protein